MAAFGADLEPVHCSPDLMVVRVNTTRAWRHKDGEISALQVDRVARLLAGAEAAQLRVLVAHPPVAVTRAQDLPNRLRGHAAAPPRCSAGLLLALTSSWAGTSTCLRDGARRSSVWRARCGPCRRARRCRLGAQGCAQLGEPAALGRRLSAGLLPDRAVGLRG